MALRLSNGLSVSCVGELWGPVAPAVLVATTLTTLTHLLSPPWGPAVNRHGPHRLLLPPEFKHLLLATGCFPICLRGSQRSNDMAPQRFVLHPEYLICYGQRGGLVLIALLAPSRCDVQLVMALPSRPRSPVNVHCCMHPRTPALLSCLRGLCWMRRPRSCCRRAAVQTVPCRGGIAALASLRAIAVRATCCSCLPAAPRLLVGGPSVPGLRYTVAPRQQL